VFRNTFGYGNAARKIIVKGCLEALYLYASTIWDFALKRKSVIRSIRAAQRRLTHCVREGIKTYVMQSQLFLLVSLPWILQLKSAAYSTDIKRNTFLSYGTE